MKLFKWLTLLMFFNLIESNRFPKKPGRAYSNQADNASKMMKKCIVLMVKRLYRKLVFALEILMFAPSCSCPIG